MEFLETVRGMLLVQAQGDPMLTLFWHGFIEPIFCEWMISLVLNT